MTCVEQPACVLANAAPRMPELVPESEGQQDEPPLQKRPSQHFSMNTPRSPRSPPDAALVSPNAGLRSRASATKSSSSGSSDHRRGDASRAATRQNGRVETSGQHSPRPEDVDADAGKLYEWQFEILNTFPREKGIALVDFLKLTDRRRIEASENAAELQEQLAKLQTQLDLHHRHRWLRRLGVAFAALLLLLLGSLSGHCCQFGPWLEAKAGVRLVAPQADACAWQADEIAEIDRLKDEHEVMSYQLERMQIDIEDARKSGRPVVCWPVGDKEED